MHTTPFSYATGAQEVTAIIVVEINGGVFHHAEHKAVGVVFYQPTLCSKVLGGLELYVIVVSIVACHNAGVYQITVRALSLIDHLKTSVGGADKCPACVCVERLAGLLQGYFARGFAVVNKILAADVEVIVNGGVSFFGINYGPLALRFQRSGECGCGMLLRSGEVYGVVGVDRGGRLIFG